MRKPKIVKQNVGVDISKDDFKICFYLLNEAFRLTIKGTRTFKNNLRGFTDFSEWVDKRCSEDAPVRITVEATGVYYEQLVHFLNSKTDFRISVVLPNKSKAFAKSDNIKSKTDAIDAKVLGRMGIEKNLKKWQPICPNMLSIKQLSRDRVSLIDEKIVLMNKLHALEHSFGPHKEVVKRMKERLRLVKKQIKQVEKQFQQACQADGFLNERIQKICDIKGLGFITVASVVAEMNGFELFTSRAQVTSYVGYDVVERESGTSVRGKTRISKKGNRFIRRALHFPAIVVVKYEPRFTQLFERVYGRTAIKMKAYVAVQRKLLLLIYALFSKNQAYDPAYSNEN